MKKKLKAGWLVMAAAIVTGMASCSSEDVATEAPVAPPVVEATATTVSVSVGAGLGNDGTTRTDVSTATDSETGRTSRTLLFSANGKDRLFVYAHLDGELNESRYLAGYLDMVDGSLSSDRKSATFEGSLTVYDNSGQPTTYDFGDADPLADCQSHWAELISDSFTDGFFKVSGGYITSYDYEKCLVTGEEDNVSTLMKQALRVSTMTYSAKDGFTGFHGLPIFNCTISGLSPNGRYGVKLLDWPSQDDYEMDGGGTGYWYDTYVYSDDTGTATFAISTDERIDWGTYRFESRYYVLRLGNDYDIKLGQRTLEMDKVYNVKRDASGRPTITWRIPASASDVIIHDDVYEIYTNDDVDFTISGVSDGYRISNSGGTIGLNSVNATYDGGEDSFICAWNSLTLDISGANTIVCKNRDHAIKTEYGELRLSGNGTLTVTVRSEKFCGLCGRDNYNGYDYEKTGELDVTSVLAAEGYTVIRSARTESEDNGGNRFYTWTYTVRPAQ